MGWGQMRTRCEPAMSTFISVLKVDIDQGVRPDKFVPGPILSDPDVRPVVRKAYSRPSVPLLLMICW